MVDVVFRVDASTIMGSGHVMRCLTLATALKSLGHSVHFICQGLSGHMADSIRGQGFTTTLTQCSQPSHAPFNWAADAVLFIKHMGHLDTKLLVIDHYGINDQWHKAVRPYVKRILVIDDLADRPHDCDWLLDQTYQRKSESYANLSPTYCKHLLGTQYALLRPDFVQWREQSLSRRDASQRVHKILISMGGSDANNLSGLILECLQNIAWQDNPPEIDLVIGASNPHAQSLARRIAQYSSKARLLTNVSNMAELMADADLAIGAGGMTSWERCCMGLPALVVVCAQNQTRITEKLKNSGAIISLGWHKNINPAVLSKNILELTRDHKMLKAMSNSARTICDGTGVAHCINALNL